MKIVIWTRPSLSLATYGDIASMSWTPEIWQGYLHRNRGSLTALERLAAIPELRAEARRGDTT